MLVYFSKDISLFKNSATEFNFSNFLIFLFSFSSFFGGGGGDFPRRGKM